MIITTIYYNHVRNVPHYALLQFSLTCLKRFTADTETVKDSQQRTARLSSAWPASTLRTSSSEVKMLDKDLARFTSSNSSNSSSESESTESSSESTTSASAAYAQRAVISQLHIRKLWKCKIEWSVDRLATTNNHTMKAKQH